jgi:hypothetical protein
MRTPLHLLDCLVINYNRSITIIAQILQSNVVFDVFNGVPSVTGNDNGGSESLCDGQVFGLRFSLC